MSQENQDTSGSGQVKKPNLQNVSFKACADTLNY